MTIFSNNRSSRGDVNSGDANRDDTNGAVARDKGAVAQDKNVQGQTPKQGTPQQ